MYKAGKSWVVAPLVFFGLVAGLELTTNFAAADTVNQNDPTTVAAKTTSDTSQQEKSTVAATAQATTANNTTSSASAAESQPANANTQDATSVDKSQTTTTSTANEAAATTTTTQTATQATTQQNTSTRLAVSKVVVKKNVVNASALAANKTQVTQPQINYGGDITYDVSGNGGAKATNATNVSGVSNSSNSIPSVTNASTTVRNFVNQIGSAAMQVAQEYGVYASMMIAQAGLESAWGQSQLARQAHNLFGVKYNGRGEYVLMPTLEFYGGAYHTVYAKFQKYSSYYDSLVRYAQLLRSNFLNSTKRAGSYQRAAQNLRHGVYGAYATDPTYASKLTNLINTYSLYRFDQPVSQEKYENGHWYLYKNGQRQTVFQHLSQGNRVVYYNSQGQMVYGQQKINGHWYYFDENSGAMQTGVKYIASQHKNVYYNSQGQLQYGEQKIKGHWYLFDKWSGAMKRGFQKLHDGRIVYYSLDGQMKYGWQKDQGYWYYLDNHTGAVTRGQKKIAGHWYNFDTKTGQMSVGLTYLNDENKLVYYAPNGWMKYGWQQDQGYWYYLDNYTGAVTRGQKKIAGHWYNFDTKTGRMSIGLTYLNDENKLVYYAPNGWMKYGEQKINGHWYLFDKWSGAMKKGFQALPDGRTVYYNEIGQMQYGWQVIRDNRYYFDPYSGEMAKGRKQITDETYFFDKDTGIMRINELILNESRKTLNYIGPNGKLISGQVYSIDHTDYVFNNFGDLEHMTGEAKIDGHWYLFGADNKVLTGIQKLSDGRTVYYGLDNGQMQYGEQKISDHWYLFDKWSGEMKTNFQHLDDGRTVYYASNGQMQYGRQNIGGHWYLFNDESGEMYKGWKLEGHDWYYYNTNNGQMQTGNATINGVNYTFASDGKQIPNYHIDYTYALAPGQGDSGKAANNYIVLHEVGVESGAAANARYFKQNLNRSKTYVTFVVGDGGKVYQVGAPGQISWGAGYNANHNAPIQIELGRTWNSSQFWQDYKTYVRLARDMAGKYGIPLTLDAGSAGTRGIKSHYWVTQHIWGDHVDPYGYLARFGVTKDKLAHDLLYGI